MFIIMFSQNSVNVLLKNMLMAYFAVYHCVLKLDTVYTIRTVC